MGERAAHVEARRIRERHAGEHELARHLRGARPPRARASCTLSLTPSTSRRRAATQRLDRDLVLHRQRDHVGEVVLALRSCRFAARPSQPRSSRAGRGQHAGVALAERELARCVASFCSTMRCTPRRARRARCGRSRAGHRASRVRSTQVAAVRRSASSSAQRRAADERHVAVQHQHRVGVGNLRHAPAAPRARCRGARRCSTQLTGSSCERRRAPRSPPCPYTTWMAAGSSARAVSMTCLSSGAPGERLQHLRQRRLHALALAGGEDHDRERRAALARARGSVA